MSEINFEALVENVYGWWWGDVVERIMLMDSDLLRDLPNNIERKKWLLRAKAESLRISIQERVDEISEAWDDENELSTDLLLEAFPAYLKTYGNALSTKHHQSWLDKAALAASGRNEGFVANESVVYFVTPDNTVVKIGHTASLRSRLRSLRTAHPKKLNILLVLKGSRKEEQYLHGQFADFHIGGEWFMLEGAVKKYIESKRFNALKCSQATACRRTVEYTSAATTISAPWKMY